MGDEDLAVAIAELAGSILAGFWRTPLWRGADRARAAELTANRVILAALAAHRPRDFVLSEEGDGGETAGGTRCWIVDPLDGTREFAEGRHDWAVQMALAESGRPALGAVFLPASGLLLRSDKPPALPPPADPIRILVSRTRPAVEATSLAEKLGAELVPMGSAGAKVAALLTGGGEAYLHSGGQFQWDSCAPVAVALAAGLDATRLNGDPLAYPGTRASLPDLVVSHPAVTARLREVLALPVSIMSGDKVTNVA
jgi:3'(2'), 5'-bisphosphate nucleotidase